MAQLQQLLAERTSRKAILCDLSLWLPWPTILTPVVLKFLQLPPFAVITSIEQVSDMAPDLHQFFSFMTIVLRWWYWLANDAQDIVTTKHANKRSIQIYLSSGGICNLILRVNKVNTQKLTPSFTSTKTLMKICYLQQQYIHIHMLRAEFCLVLSFWTDQASLCMKYSLNLHTNLIMLLGTFFSNFHTILVSVLGLRLIFGW